MLKRKLSKAGIGAVAVALVIAAAFNTQAQAAIGVYQASKSIKTVGGSIVGASGAGLVLGLALNASALDLLVVVSGAVLPVGLIVLDAERTTVRYSALSAEEAEKMNINESELLAFNSELDLINATAEAVSSQLVDTSTITDAAHLWDENGNAISDEARSAVSKIGQAALRKFQGQ